MANEDLWGDFEVLSTSAPGVLAVRYDWRNTSLLTQHNFADRRAKAAFEAKVPRGRRLVDVFANNHSEGDGRGRHEETLEPYAWRWFRVGSADNSVRRSAL